MVILNETVYNNIVRMLSTSQGLSIECEDEIVKSYPDLPKDTIRSIISKHGQNSLKSFFYKFASRSRSILAE